MIQLYTVFMRQNLVSNKQIGSKQKDKKKNTPFIKDPKKSWTGYTNITQK